jgi:conflict system STAND superfamily ATPase
MTATTIPGEATVFRRLEVPRTPYKGLEPFGARDAPFFFGRARDRRIITANLQSSRLTLVYGASGVGKTSVLNAGVAFHLERVAREQLALAGRPGLAVVVFDNWKAPDPVGRLAQTIDVALHKLVPDQSDQQAEQSPSLQAALQRASNILRGDVLIILDQFEEYFRTQPRRTPGEFLYEFPRVFDASELRAHYVISIRDDAWSRLDCFKSTIPSIFDNFYRIHHLTTDDARDAIVQPLRVWEAVTGERVRIEPALVEAVLRDVQVGQGIFEGVTGADTRLAPVTVAESGTPRIETP